MTDEIRLLDGQERGKRGEGSDRTACPMTFDPERQQMATPHVITWKAKDVEEELMDVVVESQRNG